MNDPFEPERFRKVSSGTDDGSPGGQRLDALFQGLPSELEPPDPDSPRGRILEAARILFAGRGFDGTSTRAIADAAGVNLAMVHYYYGSKDVLYRRVITSQFIRGFRIIAESLPLELPPEEAIIALPRRLISTLRPNPVWGRLIQRELADGGARIRLVLEELGARGPLGIKELLLERYRQAVARGRLKELPPNALIQFILSLSYGFLFMEPLFKAITGDDFDDEGTWNALMAAFDAILRRGLIQRRDI